MSDELDTILQAVLYRSDCPDSQVLGNYHIGLLSESDQVGIQEHLHSCPHCQAELERLGQYLETATAVSSESNWVQANHFEWQQLRETGQIIIRLLSEALSPPNQIQPGVVKGTASPSETDGVLRHIMLTPDELDDVDLEAVIERSQDSSDEGVLLVRIQIPSRWPQFAGILVRVSTDNWRDETETNEDGNAIFRHVPIEELDTLFIDIQS